MVSRKRLMDAAKLLATEPMRDWPDETLETARFDERRTRLEAAYRNAIDEATRRIMATSLYEE
jgi:hypothetical protein